MCDVPLIEEDQEYFVVGKNKLHCKQCYEKNYSKKQVAPVTPGKSKKAIRFWSATEEEREKIRQKNRIKCRVYRARKRGIEVNVVGEFIFKWYAPTANK